MTALFVWLLLRDLAARRAQAAAVEQAVRMDALGRLTGGVAHDFNNRLMIIQGNADTLARRLADQEAAQRPLASIRLATDRGAKLVRQLLTFARGGPTETRIVDPTKRLPRCGWRWSRWPASRSACACIRPNRMRGWNSTRCSWRRR